MIDIDHLQHWVGREQTVRDGLDPFRARGLAGVFDRAPASDDGDALPLPWQWLYFLDVPTTAATGADGHPDKGGFLPPVPLPRRMWAAGDMQIHRAMRLGRPAERRSRIDSVKLKPGKTGPLVFVVVEHSYWQDDTCCILESQHLVYREAATGVQPVAPGAPAAEVPDWQRTVDPDPVMLFRYSALTFNGHRIHYDKDYAVTREFYPGLVVHGPLLASWLMELLSAETGGAEVAQFGFRAVRPTYARGPIRLCGRRNGNEVSLWSLDQDGLVCMTASAVLAV